LPNTSSASNPSPSYWAVARSEPGREKLAEYTLNLRGYPTYTPRILERRVQRHGKVVEVVTSLFTNYLFVGIAEQWHEARWCCGVSAIILNGGVPARVPPQVLFDLRAREGSDGLIHLAPPLRPEFLPGDKLKIVQGPFVGRICLCAGMGPRQRIEVLLQMLGAECRISLARTDVARLGNGAGSV
jgi:transcriptional antiterminator RfaH